MATKLSPRQSEELCAAVTTACARVGLDGRAAELIQYTVNATLRLHGEPVIVRVAGGDLGRARSARIVWTARRLVAHGAPVVEPLKCDQPVVVGRYTATFWHELTTRTAWTPEELVAPLKALHSIEPDHALPQWDPFTIAHERLAEADPVVSAEDLAWLREQWADAEAEYRSMPTEAAISGVVHGDPHTGNLLMDHTGRPVLCDLDETGVGPIAWDLVPQAVGASRFDRPAFYARFAAAYGVDVRDDPAWPVLRRIRELIMVTSVLPGLGQRPGIAAQHAHRLASLREGHHDTVWARYQ